MSKLFILCLLISGNSLATTYDVVCYLEGMEIRTLHSTYRNYALADLRMGSIMEANPETVCEIQEEEIEELEDDN